MTDLTDFAARLSALTDGRASTPRVKDGVMTLALDVGGLAPERRDGLAAAIREGALTVPGVTDVRIAMTAERRALRILAVASGKGGVGKSTLSANLAVALSRLGIRVGLVDADIYGPSQARLMGSEDRKPVARDKKLVPVTGVAGIPMLSMAHLVEPGKALAWRGPMVSGALGQLIDAEWGDVELLVVDLPPGTGDIQLSMVQKHKPAGTVIVSTPQDLALIDATRAISLFEQAGVPVLGLVENMAGYACPHCGEVSDPFGQGGAEATAQQLGLPFLGRIPLAIDIRRQSDAGDPPAAGDGPYGDAFRAIARTVADRIGMIAC
ncbi:ATP-binding protein involved in chromosome partitioning [Sphingobium sp. OAS761]|uniref:Mrp/NBP35 family ATP-binding protein n=1 Tax=Sphingobium sp. OAS761 TaxID=2817901 RepID=UPI0026464D64|nr:Mrp/NBP35 family ATP-binding protein [Sphingobium sp. OAS761]MCP1470579.1 ATP-binding protein involved in chromosome partitioning [Sphingobium sp. OAS761]